MFPGTTAVPKTFAEILDAYTKMYPDGKIILAVGAEGSGKSTLIKLLVEAAPDKVTAIYFSKALGEFLNSQVCIDDFHIDQIVKTRGQMKVRDKNIYPRLVTAALQHAVAAAKAAGYKIIICDGFPRMDWQCEECQEIFGISFPRAAYMLLHADCPLREALRRCVEYRGDSPEIIQAAHQYYDQTSRGIINLTSGFATFVTVYTGGSPEETGQHLLQALFCHHKMAAKPRRPGTHLPEALRDVS